MTIAQSLLPEYDQEMANTRRTLERVPDEHLAWAPHAKSMTLARLASHVAELPSWGSMTVMTSELDLAPVGGPGYKPTIHPSRAAMLDAFDAHAAASREAIGAADDTALFEPWTLKSGGASIFTMPKIAVLRSFVFNHIVHHRGQLTVYLRLLDVPVPALYGPSADES